LHLHHHTGRYDDDSATSTTTTNEEQEKMVLAFIEGFVASQRFHRAIEAVQNDESINELAFVCVSFCDETIEIISNRLLGQHQRTWNSILISSCSGNLAAAIGCVLRADVESLELRSLQSFDETIGGAVGQGLASSETLKKLTLSILTLRKEAIVAMGNAIKEKNGPPINSGLESLRLSCCTIPTDAMKDVATSLLSRITSLQTIKLDSCKLEDAQMSIFLEALRFHPNLKDIIFPYNKCGSETIQKISQHLSAADCQIRTLDCGRQYNEDVTIDFGPMMLALKHNSSLLSLNISYTTLGCRDAIALASTLKTSKLEILYLCGNHLSLKSIQALSVGLPQTQHLKRLWLTGTQSFGRDGIISLCSGLQDNMSLEEVLVPPWLPEQATKIEYYTDLNRGGRKLFRDLTLPSSVWPQVLSRVNNNAPDMGGDPDCFGTSPMRRVSTLYHLLRNRVLLEGAV
jgi:hypothetical protein